METMDSLVLRQQRGAKNQSLFREVNERIEELRSSGEMIGFACECDVDDCTASIPMTVEEYEEVRRFPTHFVVLAGHVIDEIERVVLETERYTVVGKVGAGARIAIKLDPRSRNGAGARTSFKVDASSRNGVTR